MRVGSVRSVRFSIRFAPVTKTSFCAGRRFSSLHEHDDRLCVVCTTQFLPLASAVSRLGHRDVADSLSRGRAAQWAAFPTSDLNSSSGAFFLLALQAAHRLRGARRRGLWLHVLR